MLLGLVITLIIGFLLSIFLVIARKGRKLRTAHRLPGEATSATLEDSSGKRYPVHRETQFYLGSNASSDVVLPDAAREYAVCIFYHRKRFAFQTLSSARGVLVNGDEIMAGYLSNEDVLEIGGKRFVFRCD